MCEAQEIVTHGLVDCPDLRDIRRKLRSKVGDAFRSVSSPLRGLTEGKKGNPDTVSRARTVTAVLGFAEASCGFVGVARYRGSLTMGTAIRPR